MQDAGDGDAEDDRGIKAEIGEVPLREQRDLADCGRSYDGPEWSAAEKRRTEIVNFIPRQEATDRMRRYGE